MPTPAAAAPPVELAVAGMRCAGCAQTIEAALRRVSGVAAAEVSFSAGLALVRGRGAEPPPIAALIGAVAAAGYAARPAGATADRALLRAETRALLLALLLVALAVMVEHASPPTLGAARAWLLAVFAVAAVAGPGASFLQGAWQGLRVRRAGMDLLVALGAGAAALTGVLAAAGLVPAEFDHGHAALWLVAFLRAGKWLEARVRRRASATLLDLLDALPPRVRVERNGGESELPAAELVVGDVLVVRAAERIAADGVVRRGNSEVDEAAVTGESLPVVKVAGAFVYAGSINRGGALHVEVTALGGSSRLGQMAALVRTALVEKAPVATVTERVASVFVPLVLLLAAATAAGWWWAGGTAGQILARTLATIVISCPCALALATPTAVLAGSARALRRGILVKHSGVLERLARVRTVLFDKTGTLTLGRPALVGGPHWPPSPEDALRVKALADRSNHPVARAVSAALAGGNEALEVTEVSEIAGAGIHGRIGGREWRLGAPAFAAGEAPPGGASERSRIVAACEGRVVAVGELDDPPHPAAAGAVAALRSLGCEVALVTGDREAPARALARELAIEQVHAEYTPVMKAELVAASERAGRPVLFVGDGFNDGAALAAASVGAAMGGGTELARAAGNVVFLRNDPADAARAVALGRATLRVIRQNLLLAVAYNAVAIPWAMGLLHALGIPEPGPEHAGLAMALSSLVVVLNAARLLHPAGGARAYPG